MATVQTTGHSEASTRRSVPITVRHLSMLREIAQSERRSVQAQMSLMLEAAIERHPVTRAKKRDSTQAAGEQSTSQ